MGKHGKKMRVVLLGTGTSFGIPTIGCHCAVCKSSDPKNKRLRSGAYVELGKFHFLIDCSPDFRTQALQSQIERVDAVFFTHTHFDHIAGIDDLRVFTVHNEKAIDVYGNQAVIDEIKLRYSYFFNPPQIGGGILRLQLHLLEEPIKIGDLLVTPIPVKHGILDILGYRFNDFGYVTDASYIPESSIELLKGVKVLVLNALRERPHQTHFSLGQALEVARIINPQQTYFTHICHRLEHHATNRKLPPQFQLAYDGLEIEI